MNNWFWDSDELELIIKENSNFLFLKLDYYKL